MLLTILPVFITSHTLYLFFVIFLFPEELSLAFHLSWSKKRLYFTVIFERCFCKVEKVLTQSCLSLTWLFMRNLLAFFFFIPLHQPTARR